jgi:ATP-dependent HslUV protease, peptidase subunit HslV
VSTIVIVKKNGKVSIAGDTLTTFGDTKLSASMDKHHDKIQQYKDSYIGVVGSAAHALVIEDIFQEPPVKLDFSSRSAIFKTFLLLHPILKDRYFLNSKGEENDPYETSQIDAVIANKHGIFAVYGLRDVNVFEKYWAIGSGGDYALGAMSAVYDTLSSAEEIARAGITAGVEFDNASALPMTIQSVPLKKTA